MVCVFGGGRATRRTRTVTSAQTRQPNLSVVESSGQIEGRTWDEHPVVLLHQGPRVDVLHAASAAAHARPQADRPYRLGGARNRSSRVAADREGASARAAAPRAKTQQSDSDTQRPVRVSGRGWTTGRSGRSHNPPRAAVLAAPELTRGLRSILAEGGTPAGSRPKGQPECAPTGLPAPRRLGLSGRRADSRVGCVGERRGTRKERGESRGGAGGLERTAGTTGEREPPALLGT